MPELPEVETVVRRLRRDIGGKRIVAAHILWERLIENLSPAEFLRRIVGERVVALSRRGKYILIELGNGAFWIVHLRMSGRFRFYVAGDPPQQTRHLRFLARFEDGSHLLFINPRKFARFYLTREPEILLRHLGPEPLSPAFTATTLAAALQGRRQAIKPLLLTQRVVAGLGNIYACEALWRAGIDPRKPGGMLEWNEVVALREAIVIVLKDAIQRGGSTLRDGGYLTPNGARGKAQEALAVYGREGEPCPQCGATIVRFVQAGRSTYACPRCQRIDEG